MASCVLVGGLDASVNCAEMTSLFESAGTIVQAVTCSPAANGSPGAALVYFVERDAAVEAVNLFDSHPFAGCFLEVKAVDNTVAARVLAALAELQLGAGISQPKAPSTHPPMTAQPGTFAAPVATPTSAFESGPAVPMSQQYAAPSSEPPTRGPSTAPSTAASGSVPEPPEFGGSDYNPADWLPPADWQPSAAVTSAAPVAAAPPPPGAPGTAAAPAAAGAARPAVAALPAAAQPRKAPQPSSTAAPKAPEWETDNRCHIYVQNLRTGCRAEDLKAYFSKFGPLVDASVVPKQRIGFLTFATGDAGQAALEAVNGCSVPVLSPSGSEALRLSYRSIDKIRRHFETKRSNVLDHPTTRVFFGYFPRTTKAKDVQVELERYGDVLEVVLGGGEDGGERYCFAQFKRVQDAARAKAAIHGRSIPSLAGPRQLVAHFKEPRRM